MSYATGLRTGRVENAALHAIASSNPQMSADYQKLVSRLTEINILEPYVDSEGNDGQRLTELGRLFEDETLALFFSPR